MNEANANNRRLKSLLIRRTDHSDIENPIDLGFLCESLLFYQNVAIVADDVIIKQLIRKLGTDTLLSLLGMGALNIHYCPRSLGLMSTPGKANQLQPIRISRGKYVDQIGFFQELIFEKERKLGRSRRLSQRLAAQIPVVEVSSKVEKAFLTNTLDRKYVRDSLSELVSYLVRRDDLMRDFDYSAELDGDSVVFRTNLDYAKLNHEYHKCISPSHSSLTDSFLLCHLLDVQSDIYFAASYESEIATDKKYQLLQRFEIERLLRRFQSSQEELSNFHQTIFPDSRDIRSAINTGARSIDEFLVILEKSLRFKAWLKDKPDDISLISAYFKEATSESWVAKLPAKVARWAIFVALGEVVAPGGWKAGAALSAVDTFYLDKILKKWRPDQFINGDYRTFLNQK